MRYSRKSIRKVRSGQTVYRVCGRVYDGKVRFSVETCRPVGKLYLHFKYGISPAIGPRTGGSSPLNPNWKYMQHWHTGDLHGDAAFSSRRQAQRFADRANSGAPELDQLTQSKLERDELDRVLSEMRQREYDRQHEDPTPYQQDEEFEA